jgi:hypothetical protein
MLNRLFVILLVLFFANCKFRQLDTKEGKPKVILSQTRECQTFKECTSLPKAEACMWAPNDVHGWCVKKDKHGVLVNTFELKL